MEILAQLPVLLPELFPLIHDYVDRIGGSRMTERFRATFDGMGAASPWSRLTPKEKKARKRASLGRACGGKFESHPS